MKIKRFNESEEFINGIPSIFEMIRTIIDGGIINGNEINLDKLYMLYYGLLDEGAINVIEGEFDLPGYVLV